MTYRSQKTKVSFPQNTLILPFFAGFAKEMQKRKCYIVRYISRIQYILCIFAFLHFCVLYFNKTL